jgi:hypothetical protein
MKNEHKHSPRGSRRFGTPSGDRAPQSGHTAERFDLTECVIKVAKTLYLVNQNSIVSSKNWRERPAFSTARSHDADT